MSAVRTKLSESSVTKLKKAFSRKEMEDLFSLVMGERYMRTLPYVEALHRLFHMDLPSDQRTTRMRISEQDRERCIIALLAARGEEKHLALHIYVGLMLGITSEEIADIIFLTGVYSGVPAVAGGLETQVKVLEALERVATGKTEEPETAPKEVPGRGGKKGEKRPSAGKAAKPDITAVFKELQKALRL